MVSGNRMNRCLRPVAVVRYAAAAAACFVSAAAHADTKSILPNGVDNLKMTAKGVATFTPSTLENLLDGEAEAIRRYNFKEAAHGEYAPGGAGNQLMTADVFVLGSATEAYGLYSSQRNSHATFLKIGAEGYQESTVLNFWKGPYYVRLAITASDKKPFQASMPKLAAAIATKLTGTTALPDIVKVLPDGFTPRTEQYRLSDIAAQSYIRNGMVAKYPSAGQQAELFVAVYPTAAAAKEAFTKYSAYLTKPSNVAVGAAVTQPAGLGEKALSLKTKYAGVVITAVKGKTLVGIRNVGPDPKSQTAAAGIVKAAVAKAK